MSRQSPEWQKRASCKDHPDPDLFHRHENLKGTGAKGERDMAIAEAKAVCAGCPVRQECLDYALRNREGYGIWGGKTAHERRQILVQRGELPPVMMKNSRPNWGRREAKCGTRGGFEAGCRCDACRHTQNEYKVRWDATNRNGRQVKQSPCDCHYCVKTAGAWH